MGDKILSIIEEDGFKIEKDSYESFEGIIIVTDKQKIYLGVSDDQQCCESAGYITSEDDYTDFIGSAINKIYVTDCQLDSIDMSDYDFDWGGGCIFVNIETNRGKLQFVAYNEHNGYYGHTVRVKSEQLELEDCV